MKVRELIEELKGLDQEWEVMIPLPKAMSPDEPLGLMKIASIHTHEHEYGPGRYFLFYTMGRSVELPDDSEGENLD